MLKEISYEQLLQEIETIINNTSEGIKLSKEDFDFLASKPNTKLLFGNAKVQGKDATLNAIYQLINSDPKIGQSQSCILHFTMHPKYEMSNITKVMDIIYEALPNDADIIFGTSCDERLEKEHIAVDCFFAKNISF